MYKFVIVSSLVAVCAAQLVQDTPEVAYAKAQHFAAVAKAQALTLSVPIVHTATQVLHDVPTWKVWDGVPAPIVVADGHVQDTVEVAAEKAKHYALVSAAASHGAATGDYDDGKYRHDPSGDYIAHIPAPVLPTPFVPQVSAFAPLPYKYAPAPYQYASSPVFVPAQKLYDDGQYHHDIGGQYIPNYVPAPLK